ncbi:hypothetical protein J2T57_002626 [Natronocella acetinitrilica]|uniref:Uncharacterized protein n=1 Tax=Natronocella acetinitrilica TaxID=414046 RepID=A0AAE3G681_9GAMM|nr:hypothetical protein [Natronocella acetinitrilica]MCP1675476.1 hypothetical protein [Natronocella acetinitrilica]
MAEKQMELSFEGGLLDQFPQYRDVVRAAVYGCGRQFKAIAADLDMSPSLLSRMLADNPDDNRNFPLDRLPELIGATQDRRPVYWLVERFLEDPKRRKRQAADTLCELLPRIEQALKELER